MKRSIFESSGDDGNEGIYGKGFLRYCSEMGFGDMIDLLKAEKEAADWEHGPCVNDTKL